MLLRDVAKTIESPKKALIKLPPFSSTDTETTMPGPRKSGL
jgi:hypothetical protein